MLGTLWGLLACLSEKVCSATLIDDFNSSPEFHYRFVPRDAWCATSSLFASVIDDIDGLVQDYSNSSALAMELL